VPRVRALALAAIVVGIPLLALAPALAATLIAATLIGWWQGVVAALGLVVVLALELRLEPPIDASVPGMEDVRRPRRSVALPGGFWLAWILCVGVVGIEFGIVLGGTTRPAPGWHPVARSHCRRDAADHLWRVSPPAGPRSWRSSRRHPCSPSALGAGAGSSTLDRNLIAIG
jgi:hypothetical protein